MESDDLRHIVPRKRSRSPSEAPLDVSSATITPGPVGPPNQMNLQADVPTWQARQPKRQRRNKDVPDYDAAPDRDVLQQMGKSNPLSRKALKKDAKRARKAHRALAQAVEGAGGGGMEIDDGLEFTFIS